MMYDDYNDFSRIGGTRWALEEEIIESAHKVRISNPNSDFRGGLPLVSDGDTVYLDASDAHQLILGSSGSKKTRLFAMPMLELFMRAGESVVVTDPKSELYDRTASRFEENGYNVYVLNLRDPLHSDGWNPLLVAREYFRTGDEEKATSIINDFTNTFLFDPPGSKTDPFWLHSSRAMLAGLLHMIVENIQYIGDQHVNLLTLRNFSSDLKLDSSHLNPSTFDLLDCYPEDSMARYNLDSIRRGAEKTFDNIKVSYDAPMQRLYMQRSLIRMLSVNNVRFTDLGESKTIVYIIMPDEKTTLHAVVSLIIKHCYEQLIDFAQVHEGNTLPTRVNFLLDEFSNLPAIPDMSAMISAARSRNIRFHLIVQGLHQLSSKYGIDEAQTIKGNCGNWVFLTSRELPLLQEIRDLCGTNIHTGEPLITVSQLQRLNKDRGEALMLIGRQYPFIAHLPDISEYNIPESSRRPLPSIQDKNVRGLSVYIAYERIRRAGKNKAQQAKEKTSLTEAINARFDELFGSSS